jgi:site-specific recombinase XerC
MILAESGLRASELTELDRTSVLPQSSVIRNGQIQTCGHGEVKQGKYRCRVREFFVGPAAFAALQEYLAATLTDDFEQPMFCKRNGRRLQPWVIQKIIREMCVKLDQLPIGIHALRQSLALRFVDAGLSIHSLRRVLGYCDSEQSQVIMRLTRDLLLRDYLRGIESFRGINSHSPSRFNCALCLRPGAIWAAVRSALARGSFSDCLRQELALLIAGSQ